MADKAAPKILEREYVINLRREFIKVPIYKKSKKSITAIREFISKHMKVEEVKIGSHLNHLVWSRGPKNPLPKVKVKTRKIDNYAQVELLDKPFEETKEEKEAKETKKKKAPEKETKEEKKEMTQEKENKLLKEDKAKEVLEKEEKPDVTLKEEKQKIQTKQEEEKIRSQKIVKNSQKPHKFPKK